MKLIPLSQGLYAKVDDEDYDELSKYKWCARKHSRSVYAVRTIRNNGEKYTLFMHRVIFGLDKGDKRQVDHINHDGLDNRKDNLRIVTHQQNNMNQRKSRDCSSQYIGVCWDKEKLRWRGQIMINDKKKFLGYFDTEIEAARSRDAAAIKLFGEYANLNFPVKSAAGV